MLHSRFLKVLGIVVLAGFLGGFSNGCGAPQPAGYSNQRQPVDPRRPGAQPRDDFEKGDKEAPIAASTHFAAGQFAESQGNDALAIEQYRKALTVDPKHRDTLYRLAVVYVKQRNFPDAIATWEKYVSATGGDASAHANLGFAYELAGRTSEAEQSYLKGIRRDPKNAPCRVNYGLLLARRERFNEAVLQLQTVLKEPDVHYNLASVYESLGRNEQAKLEYRKALELEPTMKDAQARLEALPN